MNERAPEHPKTVGEAVRGFDALFSAQDREELKIRFSENWESYKQSAEPLEPEKGSDRIWGERLAGYFYSTSNALRRAVKSKEISSKWLTTADQIDAFVETMGYTQESVKPFIITEEDEKLLRALGGRL